MMKTKKLTWVFVISTIVAPFTYGAMKDSMWSISTRQGESILPDVFYADAAQNEQIMPTAVSVGETVKHYYQIDRLIYPTIGNPNLYIQSDKDDAIVSVLRIEPQYVTGLIASEKKSGERTTDLTLKADTQNALNFYLIPRTDREKGVTESNQSVEKRAVKLIPTRTVRYSMAGVPEIFRKRETLQFEFAPTTAPEGLYDLRLEIVQGGKLVWNEFQYNAVKVFPTSPKNDEYSFINVTDTQISISSLLEDILMGVARKISYKELTYRSFQRFVDYINNPPQGREGDRIRKAAFITFNGDLHNGGSPATLKPSPVATTYNDEATAILAVLKELKYPLFLTAGNHDGYASTGHAPAQLADLGFTLEEVVRTKASNEAWNALATAVSRTTDTPGGKHVDIFEGQFIRRGGAQAQNMADGWKNVPAASRNLMLYDGFYQWRRTYGPLYSSWRFGKNHYVNINSFNLRQHRRTGWGMYTVNYGGGMSRFQVDWFRRLLEGDNENDIVIISHHDPRGGHNGKDHPYYFNQIEYRGMEDSALNYIGGEVVKKKACAKLPAWAIAIGKQTKDCLHDGLQEWMRPDPEWDCDDTYLGSNGQCDPVKMQGKRHLLYSGYQIIHHIAEKPNVRTMILGHTHDNRLQMFLQDDEIVPAELVLDKADDQKYHDQMASREILNPLRLFSWFRKEDPARTAKIEELKQNGIVAENRDFEKSLKLILADAGHKFTRTVQKPELAVLRLTSASNLTSQVNAVNGNAMFGFSVLDVLHNEKNRYANPQVNRVHYYQNSTASGGAFELVGSAILDRRSRMPENRNGDEAKVNLLNGMFSWK